MTAEHGVGSHDIGRGLPRGSSDRVKPLNEYGRAHADAKITVEREKTLGKILTTQRNIVKSTLGIPLDTPLRRIPAVQRRQIETLVGEDPHFIEARDELVTSYSTMVHTVSINYRNSGIPRDQLEATGYLGLVSAAEWHDPESGEFGAYASKWVNGEMLQEIRHETYEKKNWRDLKKRTILREVREALEQQLQTSPTLDQIVEKAKEQDVVLDRDEAAFLLYSGVFSRPGSVPHYADETADSIVISDPSVDVESEAITSAMLATALGALSVDQKEIVLAYYGGKTITAIAEESGRGVGTVNRIIQSSLRKMRDELGIEDAQEHATAASLESDVTLPEFPIFTQPNEKDIPLPEKSGLRIVDPNALVPEYPTFSEGEVTALWFDAFGNAKEKFPHFDDARKLFVGSAVLADLRSGKSTVQQLLASRLDQSQLEALSSPEATAYPGQPHTDHQHLQAQWQEDVQAVLKTLHAFVTVDATLATGDVTVQSLHTIQEYGERLYVLAHLYASAEKVLESKGAESLGNRRKEVLTRYMQEQTSTWDARRLAIDELATRTQLVNLVNGEARRVARVYNVPAEKANQPLCPLPEMTDLLTKQGMQGKPRSKSVGSVKEPSSLDARPRKGIDATTILRRQQAAEHQAMLAALVSQHPGSTYGEIRAMVEASGSPMAPATIEKHLREMGCVTKEKIDGHVKLYPNEPVVVAEALDDFIPVSDEFQYDDEAAAVDDTGTTYTDDESIPIYEHVITEMPKRDGFDEYLE